jgi:hypothetical protein
LSTPTSRSDARRLASTVLALTLRDGSAADTVSDWWELHAFAVKQRCAALMWRRNGAAIRARAPVDVVEAWREQALAIAEHGTAMLRLTAETQSLLTAAGVESVVLKGAALALQLYGPPIVRPTGDLDLYIPAEQRSAAREALRAAGWVHTEGGEGTEWEVLMRMEGTEQRWLDLFSFVPKHLVSRDTPPPESEVRVFDGHSVRMHSGPGVPNHLAVHLAKHEFPPLLWFVDFATAWEALSPSERDQAWARARRMHIQRYLQWALDRVAAVESAAAGEYEALGLLGFTAKGRSQPRRWRRELVLAGSLPAALRMILGFIFPRTARTPIAFLRRLAHRLRHPRQWLVDRRVLDHASHPDATRVPATRARSDRE